MEIAIWAQHHFSFIYSVVGFVCTDPKARTKETIVRAHFTKEAKCFFFFCSLLNQDSGTGIVLLIFFFFCVMPTEFCSWFYSCQLSVFKAICDFKLAVFKKNKKTKLFLHFVTSLFILFYLSSLWVLQHFRAFAGISQPQSEIFTCCFAIK